MRKILLIIPALIILLVCSPAVVAQEQAKYNFASAQGSSQIQVTPNGESTGSIFFYNIDGNQITHVVLEVAQAPATWHVAIDPPIGETRVEIGGKVISVNETLYIEPSQVLSQKIDTPPIGMVCITVPQRGYALAKEAKIIVRVPTNEKIGASNNITISATAQWLGQSGAVAIKQNRDFNFTVEVVAPTKGNTQEKILGKTTATSGAVNSATGGSLRKWWPIITGVAGAVVLVSLILLYMSRRRD